MASKPAPLVAARTRSTEKTKQEKEAAVRAAELASVVKQAAEEAASLAATQAVAAALAGVEARFAGIEEAHRQQVDFIAAGGASGSFGAPSISASEPPLFSPKARSTPPPPASPHPSDTAQAKRVLELEEALASSQKELASYWQCVELQPYSLNLVPGYPGTLVPGYRCSNNSNFSTKYHVLGYGRTIYMYSAAVPVYGRAVLLDLVRTLITTIDK